MNGQTAPRVYADINAVTRALASSGIAKSRINKDAHYRFRGIDDVLACLAPLLAKHRLCVLPRVLERTSYERQGRNGPILVGVCLKVAFDLVSVRDGSVHIIEVWGEALDEGDKATAKAMSAAYKQAMLQSFCIPVSQDDADAHSHRLTTGTEQPDPIQGWEQWALDIQELVRGCATSEAVARLQEIYRDQLRAISKRRPEIYSAIGGAIAEHRQTLERVAEKPRPKEKSRAPEETSVHA